MPDLTTMSVEQLCVAIHKCWSASEARRQLDQHQIGLDPNESKAMMYLSELTRRTDVHANIGAAIGTLQRLHAKGTNQSRAYMIQEVERALADLGAASEKGVGRE